MRTASRRATLSDYVGRRGVRIKHLKCAYPPCFAFAAGLAGRSSPEEIVGERALRAGPVDLLSGSGDFAF